MMTEEIVLTLRSVKCLLKEGERATADDWHDAHCLGNKQTGIDIECFLTCLLHNVYALLRITMIWVGYFPPPLCKWAYWKTVF